MKSIGQTLQAKEVQAAITSSNLRQSSGNCWRCLGVGTRLVQTSEGKFAQNCLCVRRRQAKALLSLIPPIFNNPRLSRLLPRPDLHPSQLAAISCMRERPNDSYLFLGKNGTGKSHFAYALYRHAIASYRPAVACTARDLLTEFRRLEVGLPAGEILRRPRVTAETLRKSGRSWFLFLDEFEKAKPSEFASEQLFNLLDAAKSFKHQIVITSNLTAEGLKDHWSRFDPIWGDSILCRLECCYQVDFF